MGHDKVGAITDGREVELTPDIVRFDFSGDDQELSQHLCLASVVCKVAK